MREVLKEFYLGNIVPAERQIASNSELQRAVNNVTRRQDNG